MKKLHVAIVSLLLLVFLTLSCQNPQKTPSQVQESVSAPASTSTLSRASELDTVITHSKKEGRVVVWGVAQSWAAATSSVSGAFKNKYGIDVEFITGFPAQLIEKLLRERRSGIYSVDINLAGPQSAYFLLKPEEVMVKIDPLLFLPDARDEKIWLGGTFNWLDADHTFLGMGVSIQPKVGYNTGMVKLEEIKTLKDLLNPKWKGKITVQDPMTPGSGNMGVKGIGSGRYGWDFMRELIKQEPVIIADSRQQAEWIAREKYPIGLFVIPGIVNEFRKSGAPIAMMIPDDYFMSAAGTYISVLKNAPHPNAAKLFLNWMLTKEGQMTYVGPSQTASGRLDVPNKELLDPSIAPEANLQYRNIDVPDWLKQESGYQKNLTDIFVPYIRR